MITAKNLIKKYESGDGELVVLKDLSINIPAGQFLAITGRSGSGKSTLLYQLGLLDRPNSGEITIDQTDVIALNDDDRTRFRLYELGYVFQDYALLPELTALENVMVPLLMQGLNYEQVVAKARQALTQIDLVDRMDNLPSQLSGGQQQRVSIARAIAHEPKIIFADEPTANLDRETAQVVLGLFKKLHQAGQTIVMVIHEQEYTKLAERVITLDDGQIISDVLQ
ncbi:MAG: ABC transporter ATP-binding protein [Candidatus Vogelbacteria bacterium]|nr:ABC transporter ATP-binding protein [Candidatus Vogelbacteria bacterium]